MDKLQRSYKLLGYAGLSAFIALALAVAVKLPLLGLPATQVFLYYSVAILCFLSGSLWAQTLNSEASSPAQLYLSNGLTLLGVACLLLNSRSSALVILACAFIYLYYREWHSSNPSRLGKSYQAMRLKLTTVVVLSHLVILGYQ
ncbi:DUF3429 domain-containing protein [Agarivorans sp. Alg241-V36]|uniref:DUF3429 domain-containing protein n=1 Tax=Agarivorans sp. Alg241-V36 TaxID=2305992 RepID=UPI0013CF4518|nr:DUF3429 domain-containing protein [Agarivorans sp. Alg241-V36]